jgi:hypothetical protein
VQNLKEKSYISCLILFNLMISDDWCSSMKGIFTKAFLGMPLRLNFYLLLKKLVNEKFDFFFQESILLFYGKYSSTFLSVIFGLYFFYCYLFYWNQFRNLESFFNFILQLFSRVKFDPYFFIAIYFIRNNL